MLKALAAGFGASMLIAAVIVSSCGGDDSKSTGGGGTATSGTAGGNGTGGDNASAGSSGTGGSVNTGGGAGSAISGLGGNFNFDAGSFDLDALAGLLTEAFGGYTCADLSGCCAKLPAQAKTECDQTVAMGVDLDCSAGVVVLKSAGYCK